MVCASYTVKFTSTGQGSRERRIHSVKMGSCFRVQVTRMLAPASKEKVEGFPVSD
jgi:hypothetical protein